MKHQRQFPGASPYFDRHKKRRWRFRVKGFTAELGAEYGSDEFIARYEAALTGSRIKGTAGAERTRSGSLDALVVSFRRSPGWLSLSDVSKKNYGREIERLRVAHGTKRIADLRRKHIMTIMAEKHDRPSAANFTLKMFRVLLAHAVDIEMRPDNPAATVKKYATNSEGFHTWTEAEITAFYAVHPFGTLAHTALTLILNTGAARSDAVALGWASVRDGRLSYRRRKTRKTSDVIIDIPIHPDLVAVLAALPRDAFTFLQTRLGASRSPNGLGNKMREWCDAAGLPECASHGLRKAISRRLAEAGATPHEIMSVTGHKSLSEVERYTRAVGRSGLADEAFEKQSKQERKLTNHPERFVNLSRNPLKNKE
jgi:integrase